MYRLEDTNSGAAMDKNKQKCKLKNGDMLWDIINVVKISLVCIQKVTESTLRMLFNQDQKKEDELINQTRLSKEYNRSCYSFTNQICTSML